jgi:Flp pilus assembly protein CpaB
VDALRPLPSRRLIARRPRRRLALALRRQPVVFWALTLVASASAFVVVQGALDAAAEGADVYGSLVPIVVARADLPPGHVIGPDDVELTPLPSRLVPTDALADAPLGRVVRHRVLAREAVAGSRLAPDGAVGIAALLLEGERAVAIPLPTHRAPLAVGQVVDVLATVDPAGVGARRATTVVAESSVVIAVDEGGITVAADAEDAVRIATALSSAVVTIAVAG